MGVVLAAAACGGNGANSDAGPGDGPDTSGPPDQLGGTVRVFAAASLTDAYGDIAAAFEAEHPGVIVELNLAGSSSLVTQILEGSPADVVATADQRTMGQLVEEQLLGAEPEVVAENALELVVPAGNPGDVGGLDDLADDDLLVGICAPQVPCGALAEDALSAAGVVAAPDTEEPNVRALLTKLTSGDLDVGLVYRSDVVAAGDAVERIAAPELDGITTAYPVAALADAGDRATADALVDFITGPEGRRILADHGFIVP
jgi:molybdate transport system substrate-binding protein